MGRRIPAPKSFPPDKEWIKGEGRVLTMKPITSWSTKSVDTTFCFSITCSMCRI